MDERDFDSIFVDNMKALRADFKCLKLPSDSSALRNAFHNYPKSLLLQLFGFLLQRYDEHRFNRLIKPLLTCYTRAVDNQLKNIFQMWVKEQPISLGLITDFSRVWNVPCPRTYCKFFAVLSTQVLEACIERGDFGVDVGLLDDVDDYIHEYLSNVSKIHSKSSVTDTLSAEDQSFPPEDKAYIQKSCFEYAELKMSSSQNVAIQELATFQIQRWNEFQDLKKRVSSLYSEWLSVKPLYSDFASVCENPPKISAMNLKGPVMSLSEMLRISGEIFVSVRDLLHRYSDAEGEIPSDLMWCSNSLNRLIESEKYANLRQIHASAQTISSKLDAIISKLQKAITDASDALSQSRSWCSSRLLGDSRGRPSMDVYSTNSSLILKSPFSPVLKSANQTDEKTPDRANSDTQPSPIKSFSDEIFETSPLIVKDELQLGDSNRQTREILKSPHDFDRHAEADDEMEEVPAKSILKFSSFSFSPENSDAADDNALFNDINNELASLLHTTTLQDKRTDADEADWGENQTVDTGEFKVPIQPEIPPITPPLVPSKVAYPRVSLKSLRFGTPISSERKIDDDDEERNAKDFPITPYFKSFSEFARDNIDPLTPVPPRPPFTPISSNFENNLRLSELPTFKDLCPKSPHSNNNNTSSRTDETFRSGNGTCENDESLGLLSLGDTDNPDSELLLSR